MTDSLFTAVNLFSPIPLLGFVVMIVLPAAFVLAFSFAQLRESRKWALAAVACVLLLFGGTFLLVQRTNALAGGVMPAPSPEAVSSLDSRR